MHQYELTQYSLFAAVSVGLHPDSIVRVLDVLCKTTLPPSVVQFIRQTTGNTGRVKLVLHGTRKFVESTDKQLLFQLRMDSEIRAAIRPTDAVSLSCRLRLPCFFLLLLLLSNSV